MASRLTRWAIATGLGMAAVFVATLPPGPSLLFGPVRYLVDGGPTGPAGLYAANETALARANFRLNRALRREQLHQLIPARAAPVVVRIDSASRIGVFRDRSRSAAAESLWKDQPRAADAPRVALFGTINPQIAHELTEFTADLCVAPFSPARAPHQFTLRRSAGACAFAYQFGPPGGAMRAWLDTVGQVSFPDTPMSTAGRGVVHHLDGSGWSGAGRFRPDNGWPWSYELEACAGGRSDRCGIALGFSSEGPHSVASPWAVYRRLGSTTQLPAALLADLGRERFSDLWRGNEPVPTAYRRLTGRSFDHWALNYIQDGVGRIEKENGLSLVGWACWLLWMGLLVGWFAVRMERRSAT